MPKSTPYYASKLHWHEILLEELKKEEKNTPLRLAPCPRAESRWVLLTSYYMLTGPWQRDQDRIWPRLRVFFPPFIHHCQGSFLQDRPTGIPMRRDDGATSSTIDAVRRIFYGLVRVSKIKFWFLNFHKKKKEP